MIKATRLVPAFALAACAAGWISPADAQQTAQAQQDERPLSPDLAQLRETVADRLEEVADKLSLTAEQRDKIKAAHASYAERYQELRKARHDLLEAEFRTMKEIFTPAQSEKVKKWVDEKIERARTAVAKREWPYIRAPHESLNDEVQAAADRLGLTSGQRTQLRDAHKAFVDRYRSQHAEVRSLVESELKSLKEILTPDQRERVHQFVEGRLAQAPAVQSVAERLHAAADKLDLSSEQREKIRETHLKFAERYHTLRHERRELMHSEFMALGAVLTPEQKEKLEEMLEDRVVVVGVEFDPNDPSTITVLSETIRDRLDAAADKLGLSSDERAKVKQIHAGYAEKYKAQHAKRKELRQEEFQALKEILTPEQREKVKSYIEDKVETASTR